MTLTTNYDVFISYSSDEQSRWLDAEFERLMGSLMAKPAPSPWAPAAPHGVLGEMARDAEVEVAAWSCVGDDIVIGHRIKGWAGWLKRRAEARGWTTSRMLDRLLVGDGPMPHRRRRIKRRPGRRL